MFLFATSVVAQPPLEVSIDGLDGELLDNVRLVLSIEQQKQNDALVEGRIHRLHQKAPAEIRRALEPFGYYRVGIESFLLQEDGVWLARYRIELGDVLPITSANITLSGEAHEDGEFSRLLEQQALQPGSPFIHSEYEKLKRSLQQLAEERGYFSAQFRTHEVKVDLAAYGAKVVIHFDSGPRFRFGDIRFSGEHPFSESFLSRYSDFSSGDYYEHRLISKLHQNLIASDYFESVDIQIGRNSAATQQVPITVVLKQRPRNLYQFGFGYGTDTGVRGMLGHQRRWLNPEGHRLSSELRSSEIQNSISLQHTVPLARPESDRLVTAAEYQEDIGGDVDSSRTLVSSSIESISGDWLRQWEISYRLEDFEIGLQQGNSTLLVPAIRYSSIRGYELMKMVRGIRLGVELRGATREVISDTNFVQTRLEIKSIVPLGQGRILLRGEAGATAVAAIEQLPPSLRFFAGGDNSVRGYGYRDIGPTDASGEVVGGRNLLVGSIEYDYPITELWRTAVFLDGGNAFNESFIEAQRGAGVGVRRVLPIGTLRIDLARAITLPERPWRLHITMGLEL